MPLAASCRRVRTPDPGIWIAADVIDLPGLILPGDQAQIGADVSGSADARGVVDRSHKGESGQLAYAWNFVSAQHFGGLASRGSNLSWARGSSAWSTGLGYDCSRRLSIPQSSESVEDHGDVDDLLEEGSLDWGDVTKGCCDHDSD